MVLELLFYIFAGALAAGVIIACLEWSTIQAWFHEHRHTASHYGELIKTQLEDGNVRIVAGIFNSHGHRTAEKVWDAQELDEEIKSKFGPKDRIRLTT